jgi:hypothetical protein
MAVFNALVAAVFLVFYFLYTNNGGDRSYFLLIASGVAFVAAIGALVAYTTFSKRFRTNR